MTKHTFLVRVQIWDIFSLCLTSKSSESLYSICVCTVTREVSLDWSYVCRLKTWWLNRSRRQRESNQNLACILMCPMKLTYVIEDAIDNRQILMSIWFVWKIYQVVFFFAYENGYALNHVWSEFSALFLCALNCRINERRIIING